MYCYINDKFIDDKKATVSIFDRSFRYGENIFETMLYKEGKIVKLSLHLDRLLKSAEAVFINITKTKQEIEDTLQELINKNQLKSSIIKIVVTRGNSSHGLGFDSTEKPLFLIMQSKFDGYPKSKYINGISAQIVKTRKIPKECLMPNIKAGASYLVNILALKEAKDKKADEAILLNLEGNIAECTTSNIFWIKDNVIYTPSLDSEIFPGITRQTVIKSARKLGFEIEEGKYKEEQILEADEVFLSYTTAGIMPVTKINGKIIGGGKIGKITKTLLEKF